MQQLPKLPCQDWHAHQNEGEGKIEGRQALDHLKWCRNAISIYCRGTASHVKDGCVEIGAQWTLCWHASLHKVAVVH